MRPARSPRLSPGAPAPAVCQERVEALSALLEGELRGRTRQELEAHLAECPGCRAELAALEALRQGLGALGPVPPPDSEAILARLHAEVPARSRGRRVAVLAALLLVGVSAVSLWAWRARQPVAGVTVAARQDPRARAQAELLQAERHYRRAIALLRQVAEERGRGWSWELRRRTEADLAVLERAISQSRDLARRAPDDPALVELVFASYRAEIDYLRDLLARTQDERI